MRFYREGLGLQTEGIVGQEFEHGVVAFCDLQPGLRLALWPRKSLSHDAGLPVGTPCATEFCLAPLSSKLLAGEFKSGDVIVVDANEHGLMFSKKGVTAAAEGSWRVANCEFRVVSRQLMVR